MAINSLLGVSDLVPRGKILQIVRATDGTDRSTTSTSFVDASISVTITPQKSDSAVLLIWSGYVAPRSGTNRQIMQITDNSNNPISGAEGTIYGVNSTIGFYSGFTEIAYSTPATTSATTYKGRFKSNDAGATARLNNGSTTGQLYAIEVSA